ncbi:hypothetical protein AB733_19320 [Photobacterium swingsii]|uniref:Methyltransferase domain-containing protein n=1 Tax=Photobacterium swingsii TaxID=680026 RepID=A0A0J8V7E3_9GAMM|nr:methyltransferase domain-containing protein [Photobacterium swingsii]KMV29146.1 hypothetical protein AB733_19320 [Photobacterium swingsii]PSW19752.1 methyltransferase domain-containing protein [Photobacterium swingsii]
MYTVDKSELYENFIVKYGDPKEVGWSPQRRLKFDYYPPNDIYETMVNKVITHETQWIDVGGGESPFPYNLPLSKDASERCRKLVAVDPSPNVLNNLYAHEKINSTLEDFTTKDKFNLATFNMVAEHIEEPDSVVNRLSQLMESGGIVVVYTINKYSPVPLLTYVTPFSMHHKIKGVFWGEDGGKESGTFPVAYKMNTRVDLERLFSKYGFLEVSFEYLDDLSSMQRFKYLNLMELYLWKGFKAINMNYPENNILAIYRKE